MAETRLSVHVYDRQYQTAQFLSYIRLKVLISSADLQLYDSEFQTEGALTLNAFADDAAPCTRCKYQSTKYYKLYTQLYTTSLLMTEFKPISVHILDISRLHNKGKEAKD